MTSAALRYGVTRRIVLGVELQSPARLLSQLVQDPLPSLVLGHQIGESKGANGGSNEGRKGTGE